MKSIVPTELYDLVRQGRPVDLIDVRTPEEYQEVHAELASCEPLDTLDPVAIMQHRKDAGQPLYLICRSGGRSEWACEQFIAAGYPNVVNVEGGTRAWLESNLPVVWGEQMPVESGGCGSPGCGCRSARG
jgi:rhodanese-related sulfurtransferase